MNYQNKPQARAATVGQTGDSRAAVMAPVLLALLTGVFLILGVGFSHSSAVHDAAHDTRHAFAFPCH